MAQTVQIGGNFTEGQPAPLVDEYRNANFSYQNCIEVDGEKAGNRIFPGDDTPRTFVECNLVNCEVPPGSTVERCNCAIKETSEVVTQEVVAEAYFEEGEPIFAGTYDVTTTTETIHAPRAFPPRVTVARVKVD